MLRLQLNRLTMFPSSSEDYIVYRFLLDAKRAFYETLRNTQREYFSYSHDTFYGKFCHAMSVSKSVSVFINRISPIFKICSSRQMFWINTKCPITRMKNKFSLWNRAFVYFIREAMRQFWILMLFYKKLAISVSPTYRASPQPARFRFFNFFPESVLNWPSFCIHAIIVSGLVIILQVFFCKELEASYIFNRGGGATTLIDDNGCVWRIGSTISTGGIVSVTLISCPFVPTQVRCRPGEPIGLLAAITCP